MNRIRWPFIFIAFLSILSVYVSTGTSQAEPLVIFEEGRYPVGWFVKDGKLQLMIMAGTHDFSPRIYDFESWAVWWAMDNSWESIPELDSTCIRISPDGLSTLAIAYGPKGSLGNLYLYGQGNNSGLFVASANFFGCPAWSFDGNQIAIPFYTDDEMRLFVLDKDGRNPYELLLPKDAWPLDIAWSPNGTQIAFHVSSETGSSLSAIDVENGRVTQLISVPDHGADYPAWSPDGRYIAYIEGVDVVVAKGDLSGEKYYLTRVGKSYYTNGLASPSDYNYRNLIWSPTGTYLAATREQAITRSLHQDIINYEEVVVLPVPIEILNNDN
jgi:WD40 repeat protein